MNEQSKPQEFIWSDAWILLAIIIASKDEAPLSGIIGVADYINHAVLTRGELETGISKLIEAGYVIQVNESFKAVGPVVLYWETAVSQKRYIRDALELMRIYIGATDWKPGDSIPDTDSEKFISKSNYEEAVREYLKAMRHSPKGK